MEKLLSSRHILTIHVQLLYRENCRLSYLLFCWKCSQTVKNNNYLLNNFNFPTFYLVIKTVLIIRLQCLCFASCCQIQLTVHLWKLSHLATEKDSLIGWKCYGDDKSSAQFRWSRISFFSLVSFNNHCRLSGEHKLYYFLNTNNMKNVTEQIKVHFITIIPLFSIPINLIFLKKSYPIILVFEEASLLRSHD